MHHNICAGPNDLWLNQMEDIDCIFADPPDNIGLAYNSYDDNLPEEEYVQLLEDWLDLFVCKAPTVWMSFNSIWTIQMGWICTQLKFKYSDLEIRPCVQTFTFGQNKKTDLTNGHRPLWRFQREGTKLYPEAIKVPSWRQQNGDKRAASGGKVPDDVFDFPRVTGNSKQRRPWHKTQLHEGLVERALKFTTRPGGKVVDPFAGTGTTLRVCRRLGFLCTLIDIDREYCANIADEHGAMLREGGECARWELPFDPDEKYVTEKFDKH